MRYTSCVDSDIDATRVLLLFLMLFFYYFFFLITDHINSVLPPPPPRYTIPVAYAAGAANGMAVPVVETNNTISHPDGGCPLQVGEGTSESNSQSWLWLSCYT